MASGRRPLPWVSLMIIMPFPVGTCSRQHGTKCTTSTLHVALKTCPPRLLRYPLRRLLLWFHHHLCHLPLSPQQRHAFGWRLQLFMIMTHLRHGGIFKENLVG